MVTRFLLLTIGFSSLAAGVIGVYVPLLPTTPFILLSLFCFSRSSEKFHTWLVSTNLYKKYVQEFKETRAVAMKSKIKIVVFLYVSVGISIYYIDSHFIRYALMGMLMLQTFVLFFIVPTRKESKMRQPHNS
ncbi:YbaN family protein [Bacillus sp. FJAT-47783]|uniref:YbaN family protein n=1 Tax=Bacillus sp. FJAT-47783 TaxID=2922712 RepID=UPI001FAD707C|nr:YbaN family protein [Bacillus sp. FJAT-47783]